MSKRNPGKVFEQQFEASVRLTKPPAYHFRLRDCGGWGSDSNLRFTPSNPFDFFLWREGGWYGDGPLYALELKSTKDASLRFDRLTKGQRKGLLEADAKGVAAGLLIEWRREPYAVTWLPISQYEWLRDEAERKSFTREEAICNGVVIPTTKRGVLYVQHLDALFNYEKERRQNV